MMKGFVKMSTLKGVNKKNTYYNKHCKGTHNQKRMCLYIYTIHMTLPSDDVQFEHPPR